MNAQKDYEKSSLDSIYNIYLEGSDKSKGIIASGIAFNYLMENFPNGINYPILKISQYPLPTELFKKITEECDEVIVMEEGAPFIEQQLRGLLDNCLNIKGRIDGTLPRDGELNPDIVAKALGFSNQEGSQIPELVTPRPPAMWQTYQSYPVQALLCVNMPSNFIDSTEKTVRNEREQTWQSECWMQT